MEDKAAPTGTFNRPPTALEAVVEELRRLMLQGVLAPASHVNQVEIANQLGVSRVPIREAMRILEGEGRIRYVPHRGYYVSEIDFDKIGEIYRIRELLETEAAIETLAQMSDDLPDRLRAVNDALRASTDASERTAWNREFHFLLIQPSGMPTLTKILDGLWNATDPYRSVYFGDGDKAKATYEEHEEIVRAVEQRDRDRVVRLLNEHRTNAIEGLEALVGEGPADEDGTRDRGSGGPRAASHQDR